MLSYAVYIWGHETHTSYISNRLEKLNRLALSLCTQVPKSTPNSALEIMLNVCPLRLHLLRTGLGTHYRLKASTPLQWEGTFSNKTYSVSHRKFWTRLSEDSQLPSRNTQYDTGIFQNCRRKYHIDRRSFLNPQHTCPSQKNIYTDGSPIDETTGAGFCVYSKGQLIHEASFRLPDYASVFQAEIFAISKAAEYLCHQPEAKYVKIHVDSQAALKALDCNELTTITSNTAATNLNLAASSLDWLSLV